MAHPNPVLADLTQTVTDTVGVMQSAEVVINGITGQIDAAVQAALDNGATATELAPFTDLNAGLKAEKDKLAAAVAANPGPPVTASRH